MLFNHIKEEGLVSEQAHQRQKTCPVLSLFIKKKEEKKKKRLHLHSNDLHSHVFRE